MKLFIITALMISSLSAFAQQEDTILVTVDVGGCINSKIMSLDSASGDEWELQLIPVDKNGKDIVSKTQKVYLDADVCEVDRERYYDERTNPEIGPEMQASIQISPNQLFRVQLEEKDWGFQYVLGGGHDKYNLGLFSPKMIDPKVEFVKGKATIHGTRDCLKMKKIL